LLRIRNGCPETVKELSEAIPSPVQDEALERELLLCVKFLKDLQKRVATPQSDDALDQDHIGCRYFNISRRWPFKDGAV